jgi:hypothetical protein
MKVLSIKEDQLSVRVQSVNGMLFIKEDWMKSDKEKKSSTTDKRK